MWKLKQKLKDMWEMLQYRHHINQMDMSYLISEINLLKILNEQNPTNLKVLWQMLFLEQRKAKLKMKMSREK